MARMIAALDLGTSKVAFAQGKMQENGKLKLLACGSVPYTGFRNGEAVDGEALEAALEQVRRNALVQSTRLLRRVLVSVPGEFLSWSVKTVSLPVHGAVQQKHLDALLEDAQLIPTARDAVVLHKMPVFYQNGQQLRGSVPLGEYADTLSACVAVACSQAHFHDTVEDVLDNLGMSVAGYVAAPVANAQTLLQGEMLTGDVLIVDVGHLSTDIYAARAGGVVYHENIEMGGANITADIAAALNIEFYEAEMRKRKQANGFFHQLVEIGDSVYTMQSVVEASINTLIHAVMNVLDTTAIDWRRMNEIYLLGDGVCSLRGGREMFSAAFGRTVKMQRSMTPLISGNTCNTAISILSYYMQYAQSRNEGVVSQLKRLLGI